MAENDKVVEKRCPWWPYVIGVMIGMLVMWGVNNIHVTGGSKDSKVTSQRAHKPAAKLPVVQKQCRKLAQGIPNYHVIEVHNLSMHNMRVRRFNGRDWEEYPVVTVPGGKLFVRVSLGADMSRLSVKTSGKWVNRTFPFSSRNPSQEIWEVS